MESKAVHVMNRLAFGPRPGDVERLASGGDSAIRGWIETQLHPEKIDNAAAEKKLATYKSVGMSVHDAYRSFFILELERGRRIPKDADLSDPAIAAKYYDISFAKLFDEMLGKKFVLAVDGERQLEEMLVDFWWNHFNVGWRTAAETIPSYDREVIRKHVFGNFHEFLRATARHPGMLVYLDNRLNNRGDGRHPTNENYARELMELHTVGVNGGYSQKDVEELARILTGWGTGDWLDHYEFTLDHHDLGTKTWLGQTFTGEKTDEEGERALLFLSRHPSTARFISMKLARFFVSDQPPDSLVERLSKRFQETKGELREVYAALFESPEFWSEGARFAKSKRPLQFIISAVRAMDGATNAAMGRGNNLSGEVSLMGEIPYKCDPPNGYEDDPAAWINPGQMVIRANFAAKLVHGRIMSVTIPKPAGETAAARILGRNPSDTLARAIKGKTPEEASVLALASADFQKR